MSLVEVDSEQQARLCGRARAKEIFQPMRWKRIGTLSDEAAKLYESARRSSSTPNSHSYTLRAVKPLRASLADVEAVLTGQTALLGREDTPTLLARLLPSTYASGGHIARYPALKHSTSERENVALQYARLRPYTAKKEQQETKTNKALLESVDNYVLLSYTLSTQLQRLDMSKKTNPNVAASVPSLLHLYRPVSAPKFAERRHDFRAEELTTNDFSITYIIQKMPSTQENDEQENETEQMVTLEVVLTWSYDPKQMDAVAYEEGDKFKTIIHQQKQRLRHDALCLTRLQPFIDAYREEKKRRPSVAPKQPPKPQHDPKDCDPNMLRGSMFAGGRACSTCHRKFGPFRWKRQCQACEKFVCNQCLSVLAIAPSLSRRKKRVCSQCLYGETANAAARHKAAVEAVLDDDKCSINSTESVRSHASLDSSTMNVFQVPSLELLVNKYKASRMAEAETPSVAASRVPIDLGLDPMLVSTPSKSLNRRRARSRQSQFSHGSVLGMTSDSRRATLPSHIDFDDVEVAVAETMRFRRAKTVLLDDMQDSPVKRHPLNLITPSSSSVSRRNLHITSEENADYEVKQPQRLVRSRSSSCRTAKIQFIQLKTPEPDYELDFSWYNIFPKAPVARTPDELARAKYVEVTGLKVDTRSLVFLRHDKTLENLASRVLKLASQWHACTINIVGRHEVYCLVTASNKPELDLDEDEDEMEASPGTVEDVIPREASVSSYVVYHKPPFFVSEMEHDPRFRAHPLHTEQGAVSLLSFPIYSSGTDVSGGSLAQGKVYCVATLDLWKKDGMPASSHISQDWMTKMGDLLRLISARLEALAKESYAFLQPRTRANHSLGSSSCGSRDSTRRADSIIDLYDVDSESTVDSPLLSQYENVDRLTNLSYAKVRGTGLNSIAGSSTWKYDSDNESTASSQSASSSCSQSSRFSSHLYSAVDLHSTIESLLHQASKTSRYISETGVSI